MKVYIYISPAFEQFKTILYKKNAQILITFFTKYKLMTQQLIEICVAPQILTAK